MRRTLEQIEKRISQLEAQQSRGREITEHFHLGRVGGSGKPVQRLNKRRSAELDQTIDHAVELQRLKSEREHLLAQAQAAPRQAERDEKEQVHNLSISEQLKRAKPGDEIVTLYGSQIPIQKVNKKSVISVMGTRYPISQIVQIIPKHMETNQISHKSGQSP